MVADDSPTKWYTFLLPSEEDLMSDPSVSITDSFEKIVKAGKCDIIADPGPPPQGGTYQVGDKIYMSGNGRNSIYVCIAVDQYWGKWWKPIHTPIGPWQVVPGSAIQHVDYEQHPTDPFSIAIDNKGRLFCRGRLRVKSGSTISNGTTVGILRPMPDGIRTPAAMGFSCAIDPVVMTNPSGVNALKTGTFFTRDTNGITFFVFYNSSASGPKTTDIFMNEVRYSPGRDDFTSP